MKITVSAIINAPIQKVWNVWTNPDHICNWNAASDEWYTPHATNDLRVGGTYNYRMEAKDGSMGFNLIGTYTSIIQFQRIEHIFEDERKITVLFESEGNSTRITESFDAETLNPVELQQQGWQAILNNFARYAESL
ncbi:MAG: SRPBCC family protein [Flavobacteriia bacterium]|jgi:uncharacterized protein YndB with AHSA1/START domain